MVHALHYVTWLYDSDSDIYDNLVTGVTHLSCFMTYVTITYDIISFIQVQNKIKKNKKK